MVLLTLENLRKGYTPPDEPGKRRAVVDIERFTLEPGEQAALAGGSGTGKTTLLNLIAGITRADTGSITLDGTDLTRLDESARDRVRAQKIGYVFQTFNLLQGYTALENVELAMMFGPRMDRDRAHHLLARVGLADRARYRPSQLSAGQQQRVAVARALANSPRLLLADEPTGNLDAASGTETLKLVRDTCTELGAALLIVSHDPALLGGFERVVQLSDLNRPDRGVAA